MAARIRLSSLAMCLVAVMVALPGSVRESKAQASGPAAGGGKPPALGADDCRKLPGGNAPINRMARLGGGLSVRNLDLTYLGKPLFEFTAADYEYLQALWPVCGTFDAETAPTVARRLKGLIDDARAVRRDSLDWIRRTEAETRSLEPGREGIERIHDLWQQMLNREFQMLESDMSHIAAVLSKRRDELYAAPQPRQRTLVSPFDPGPPEVRGLGTGGG